MGTHYSISENKFADKLANSSVSFSCPSSIKIPWSDFIPILRTCTSNLWLKHWGSLLPHVVTWYRNLSPTIPKLSWLYNFNLSRKCIISYSTVSGLSTQDFLLIPLNFRWTIPLSAHCTIYYPMVCDISHLLFICPILSTHRDHLYCPFWTPRISLSILYKFSEINKKNSILNNIIPNCWN